MADFSNKRKIKMQLSVIIIAHNEEGILGSCLKSLPECEIVVLDSGSTDNTVKIAQQYGAQVQYRKFDDYASQKNAAIKLASHDWVLSVDADEELDDLLRKEIERVVACKETKVDYAFKIQRSLVFMGKEMQFGKTSDYPIRLFRKGSGAYKGSIHEKFTFYDKHKVRKLKGKLYHYSYKDLSDYLTKFNNYTSKISGKHYEYGKKSPSFVLQILRPFWEFVYRYIFRLGLLDGRSGYAYALLSSFYVYVKYEKLRELYEKDKIEKTFLAP